MCGITGLVGKSGSVTETLIAAMTDSIAHRGPNDRGTYINPDASIGFGHRRLSIIDLSADGREPLFNEDRSIVLVFNGEIYNFKPLRDMLLTKGHVFTSQTDAEVIIHLYEEEGIECLQKFTGMFAFALYDTRSHEVFVVRDHIGIKPLYYYHSDSLLCFGSEIRAILKHPQVQISPDMVAITQYLTLNHVPAPRTGFENIYKLPPGHYIRYVHGNMEIIQYYTRNIVPYKGSYTQAKAEVWERLVASTKSMLVADVPLGGLLSGGIDSTAVIAAMREVSSTVQTFSISVPDSKKDETSKAVRAAQYLETKHTVIPISITEGLQVEELVGMYEEPYADSSAVAMHLLCQNVSKHVTVALSGDGGDEVFGGYKRYLYWKYGHYFIPNFYQKIEQNFHFSSAHIKKYAEHLLPNLNDVKRSNLHTLRDVQELSFHTFLPDDLLKKVDIASMRSALEVRVPFLDHHFVEFGLSLKDSWKIQGMTMKYILQDALQGKIPSELLWQPKQGFEVPVDDWFRQDVFIKKLDCIRMQNSHVQKIFPAIFIEKLITEHTTGAKNHGTRLWVLLNLEVWFQTYFPI